MNKKMFELALAKTTVEGTDNYNAVLEAIRKDLEGVQKNHNLEQLKNLAIATLAMSVRTTDDADVIEELEDGLEQAVNCYTAESKLQTYKAARASQEGAMRYACREYFFPTIRVKETKDKKTKRSVRSIEATLQQIELGDLHKWVKDNRKDPEQGIGADKNWQVQANTLNLNMAYETAVRYGDTETQNRLKDATCIKKKYDEAQKAMKLDCTEDDFKAMLDKAVKAMLGEEYSTIDKDWELLHDNYVTDNKKSKLGVKLSNERVFIGLLKKVCCRVVTGAPNYEVLSTYLKNKE